VGEGVRVSVGVGVGVLVGVFVAVFIGVDIIVEVGVCVRGKRRIMFKPNCNKRIEIVRETRPMIPKIMRVFRIPPINVFFLPIAVENNKFHGIRLKVNNKKPNVRKKPKTVLTPKMKNDIITRIVFMIVAIHDPRSRSDGFGCIIFRKFCLECSEMPNKKV
jgi:hypothetical protein